MRRVIVDGAAWTGATNLTTDVCVVGAGPAGLVLVDALRGSGLAVVLLESGGHLPGRAEQGLNRGDNVGLSYWRLDSTRHRVFGGSGSRWGGLCRPLDPIDLERRSWVQHSGWPVGAAELDRVGERAARALALTSASFGFDTWGAELPPVLPLGGSDFETVLFQYSPLIDFGHHYRRRVEDDEATTCLLHATVTDLRLAPGTSRVDTVCVELPDRRRLEVHARTVVLATGAVENARTLLAARTDRPDGLGNEHDLVGRYFMEHPHVPLGHVLSAGAGLDRRVYERLRRGPADLRAALAPTAAAQRERELLTCTLSVEPATYTYGAPFLGWPPSLTLQAERAYLRASRRRAPDPLAAVDGAPGRARELAKTVWYAARSMPERRAARASVAWGTAHQVPTTVVQSLYARGEQVPNASSRVTLGTPRDALGLPRAVLDWRLTEQDTAGMLAWLPVLDEAMSTRGLGRVAPPAPDWEQHIIGGPHHMGTTRMSAAPTEGVVDNQCRVHSVDNLFLAGSSVFPTGGHANPTFPLVQLAIRLADHLRQRHRAPTAR